MEYGWREAARAWRICGGERRERENDGSFGMKTAEIASLLFPNTDEN